MATIFLILLLIVMAILFRNNLVYKERGRVLAEISRLNNEDIDQGIFYTWQDRYPKYDQIFYYLMVFQFWRPIEFFYENHECLKPTKKEI